MMINTGTKHMLLSDVRSANTNKFIKMANSRLLIQLAENSLQDKKQTENEHKHKILSILLCKTIWIRYEFDSGKKNKPVFACFESRVTIQVNLHQIIHIKVSKMDIFLWKYVRDYQLG